MSVNNTQNDLTEEQKMIILLLMVNGSYGDE